MTFKRLLRVSLIHPKMAPTEKEDHRKHLCQVCGDQANTVNYGTLTCASCRTFFRRHGFRLKDIPQCSVDGSCKITKESRRICARCRFTKCLAVGMSPDLIRKEDLSKTNRLSLKSKSEQMGVGKTSTSISTASTVNPLSTDTSSLSSSDWTLISNVIHALDTFSPIAEIQHIVQLTANPSEDLHHDIEQSVKILVAIYKSLQLFIRSTVDFRMMNIAEQCSLIHRNLYGLWAFYSILIDHQCNLFNNTTSNNIMIPLCGAINVQRTKLINARVDTDLTLMQLMLITLTFSTNCYTIDVDQNRKEDCLSLNTLPLLRCQNTYVEILWKCLIHRYGYLESPKRFFELMKIVLDIMQLSSDIYDDNTLSHRAAKQLVEETERSLVHDGNTPIPLWGRSVL